MSSESDEPPLPHEEIEDLFDGVLHTSGHNSMGWKPVNIATRDTSPAMYFSANTLVGDMG